MGWPEHRMPLTTGFVHRGTEQAQEIDEMRNNSPIRADSKNSTENDSLGIKGD